MGNPLELGNQQSQGWQRLRDHVMFAKKKKPIWMLRAICCKTQRNVSLMWLSSPAFCWLNLLCVEYRNVYKTTISWLFPAQKFSIFRHETSLGM
jgi:hypothetical protein